MTTGMREITRTVTASDLPDIDTGKETVTDVSTVIVGNRLAALMSAQVEKIPFESGGVLVRVPTKVVKDWEV